MSATVNNRKKVRIYVQNLAGDSKPFDITDDETVGNLKRRIRAENLVECKPEFQQLMMIPEEEKSNSGSTASSSHAPTHTVLDDDSRRLLSYGVMAGTTLHVICNMKYLTMMDQFILKSASERSMTISPDSQQLFIPVMMDNKISMINISDGSPMKIITVKDNNNIPLTNMIIYSLCFSPDGGHFFVVGKALGETWSAFIKYTIDGTYEFMIQSNTNMDEIWSKCCISPNGRSLFIMEDNEVLHVFNTHNGDMINTIRSPENGTFIKMLDICISQHDELFILERANIGGIHRIQVFHAENGMFLRTIPLQIEDEIFQAKSMDISPDGNYLYVIDDNSATESYKYGNIYVLDASDGSQLETVKVPLVPRSGLDDICISPDGMFVFVTTRRELIKFITSKSTMGGRRYKKKGMRRKHCKSRVQRHKKNSTKRRQRK